MNTRTETELIKYFSWPAYLNIFFYIIKNKNKKWKELKREKSWPDFCYGWTFDFLKLLWVCNSYDRETNMFLLTESGEELYLIIKDIDDWLLFSHSEVNESSIEEYNKELLNNIGSEKLYVIKNILFFLINKSKWFILIKEILENKEYIIKNELYIELAKKLNVAEATIKNRAPSMLQLAIFLNIFLLEEWKIKKNIQYFISEIYEKKEEDKKINELLNEETEEKTIEIINSEIKKEENKWENKKYTYITKKSKMLSRNSKIATLVKERAKYICQSCGDNWFETKYEHWNNYMEAHHLKELAYWWEDKWDNMVCLCIECHWKIHHWSEKIQYNIYKHLKI